MKIDSWRDLEVYRNAFALQQAVFEVSKIWPGACNASEPISNIQENETVGRDGPGAPGERKIDCLAG